jgi:hypothetical protein
MEWPTHCSLPKKYTKKVKIIVSKSVILSFLCSVLHAFSDNVEVKEEDGTMAGRKTVTSKVKFSANSNDNQATYACEAVHGGLRGANMRVSFLLSVQCKPPLFLLSH